MKQILRLFAVVGVVLLAALISAGSCDKKNPDANKNTNTGDGTPQSGLRAAISDANIAKVVGNTIYLKASAFPAAVAGTAAEHFNTYNAADATTTRKKVLELLMKDATGGMMIVGDGPANHQATNVSTPLPSAVKTDATGNKGIHAHTATAATGSLEVGLNIFAVFADKTAITAATVDAKKAPFAFSATSGTDGTQPIFWCVSTITGMTTDGTTAKLTGGQKASCYIASVGAKAIGGAANATARTAWFATSPLKNSISISVLGVRTDDKTIENIGLTGANATAKLNAFNDGLTTAEMTLILGNAVGANGVNAATHTGFAILTIKVVSDADFTAAK